APPPGSAERAKTVPGFSPPPGPPALPALPARRTAANRSTPRTDTAPAAGPEPAAGRAPPPRVRRSCLFLDQGRCQKRNHQLVVPGDGIPGPARSGMRALYYVDAWPVVL